MRDSSVFISRDPKYAPVERIVSDIVAIAQGYMKGMDADSVEYEIRRAYAYARDAHE